MIYLTCDSCGRSMFEDSDCVGNKRELKTRGWLVHEDGTVSKICSICLQVELSINKDSLFERGYRKVFFGDMNSTMETAKYGYEVLPAEPWVKQFRPQNGDDRDGEM